MWKEKSTNHLTPQWLTEFPCMTPDGNIIFGWLSNKKVKRATGQCTRM
jgi:hypothetical protein